jgi:ribosome biogenesis protein MAK21
VYKNPKKPKPRGASAMQPAAALGNDVGTTVRLIKGINGEGLATVNQDDFWRKKVADIPANQVGDLLFTHESR